MKTTFKQFNFGLRLVIPITTSPGPRIAGRSRFGNHDDTPPLTMNLMADPIFFVVLRLDGLDGQGLLVDQKVAAIKAVPGRFFALECCRNVFHDLHGRVRRESGTYKTKRAQRERCPSDEFCSRLYL